MQGHLGAGTGDGWTGPRHPPVPGVRKRPLRRKPAAALQVVPEGKSPRTDGGDSDDRTGSGQQDGGALAATFFSLVGVAGIRLQLHFSAVIPHDVLLALPYLATVLGVWITGRMRGGAGAAAQASELRDQ